MQFSESVFFIFLDVESHIWPDAILWRIWQRNGVKFCANLGKSATKTLAMIRQVFVAESLSRTREVQTHRGEGKKKKARQVKSEAKSILIIYVGHQGGCSQRICPSQTVNSAYCCDVLQWNCTETLSWTDKIRNGCCITTTHRLNVSTSTFLFP
jgi:hypothetical protein